MASDKEIIKKKYPSGWGFMGKDIILELMAKAREDERKKLFEDEEGYTTCACNDKRNEVCFYHGIKDKRIAELEELIKQLKKSKCLFCDNRQDQGRFVICGPCYRKTILLKENTTIKCPKCSRILSDQEIKGTCCAICECQIMIKEE